MTSTKKNFYNSVTPIYQPPFQKDKSRLEANLKPEMQMGTSVAVAQKKVKPPRAQDVYE